MDSLRVVSADFQPFATHFLKASDCSYLVVELLAWTSYNVAHRLLREWHLTKSSIPRTSAMHHLLPKQALSTVQVTALHWLLLCTAVWQTDVRQKFCCRQIEKLQRYYYY